MGDFFAPPPGFPTPPPEPDTPPPNFSDVGMNLGIGINKSGLINSAWNGLLEILVRAAATVLGWLMTAAADIATFVIKNFNAADEKSSAAYGPLVAQVLQQLFGVSASASQLAGVNNAASRQQLGASVGAFMLNNIMAPPAGATGNGVAPSDTAPKAFLGSMTHLAIEGWLHSWIFDALTVHELEKFGDLKDVLARVLGIGRLSRQVFAPPLKVFVHDPYLALLNQTYRPTHLSEQSSIRQFLRGSISRQDLSRILGNQGWSETYIDYLINEHQKYLSDVDVDYLISRGQWTADQGSKYLSEQGWDLATAQRRLAILSDQRIDKYRREITAAAVEAYQRGEIPFTQCQTIVQQSGLSEDENTWILKAAGVKRELHATHLSRGDIERLIKEGVLNFGDLQTWAQRNQMPIDEERFLELSIAVEESKASAAAQAKAAAAKAKQQAAVQKAAAAAAKAAAAAAQAPDKGITVAEAETLVMDGIWTFDHLSSYLAARGYSASSIDAITHLLHTKIAKAAANGTAAAPATAAAKVKGVNLAQMQRAVLDGILSIGDYRTFLLGQGFDAADVTILVELAQHQLDVATTKAKAKAAADAKAAVKGISLPDIERAVRLGVTSIDTYTGALQAAGFEQHSIDLLVGILNTQMAADKAAAAKRTAAAASAGQVGVSLSQLEQEVIARIRPINDYQAALMKLGYSHDDIRDLSWLLQARVDQAYLAAEKRVQAGNAYTSRGLSIGDLEKAVKLQIVPIADYKAALQAAGYDTHTVDTLVAVLTKEVGAAAAAGAAAGKATTTAKAKGISLPDEERAVLEGVKPITDYTALLASLGYTTDVARTMTQLLQLKLDQLAAAKKRHADAVGVAAARGISMANEEAAVLAGDVTMEQYDTLLAKLGYDSTDRAILEDLLQARLDKQAAKAGTGSGG